MSEIVGSRKCMNVSTPMNHMSPCRPTVASPTVAMGRLLMRGFVTYPGHACM